MLTFYQAIFNPKTGLFEFTINLDGNRRTMVEIPPEEFLKLVQYMGKVATSYTAWLKNGGKI